MREKDVRCIAPPVPHTHIGSLLKRLSKAPLQRSRPLSAPSRTLTPSLLVCAQAAACAVVVIVSVLPDVNNKCDQKIANLSDQHQAALRVAKADGAAEARGLVRDSALLGCIE